MRDPANAEILKGLKSENPDDFAQAFAALGKMAQDKFGITSEEFGEIFLYDGSKTTSTSMASNVLLDTKGGLVIDKNNEEAGNIFINANSGVKSDMVNTLGHETLELFTFTTDGKNDAKQEAQANVFGT
jgi:filamentous hemagglutinin